MREYNIAMEHIPYVKDTDLSKDLTMAYQWNNMTLSDEDPDFLDKYNSFISDGSIPNG